MGRGTVNTEHDTIYSLPPREPTFLHFHWDLPGNICFSQPLLPIAFLYLTIYTHTHSIYIMHFILIDLLYIAYCIGIYCNIFWWITVLVFTNSWSAAAPGGQVNLRACCHAIHRRRRGGAKPVWFIVGIWILCMGYLPRSGSHFMKYLPPDLLGLTFQELMRKLWISKRELLLNLFLQILRKCDVHPFTSTMYKGSCPAARLLIRIGSNIRFRKKHQLLKWSSFFFWTIMFQMWQTYGILSSKLIDQLSQNNPPRIVLIHGSQCPTAVARLQHFVFFWLLVSSQKLQTFKKLHVLKTFWTLRTWPQRAQLHPPCVVYRPWSILWSRWKMGRRTTSVPLVGGLKLAVGPV